jgi:hypothetical protein
VDHVKWSPDWSVIGDFFSFSFSESDWSVTCICYFFSGVWNSADFIVCGQ